MLVKVVRGGADFYPCPRRELASLLAALEKISKIYEKKLEKYPDFERNDGESPKYLKSEEIGEENYKTKVELTMKHKTTGKIKKFVKTFWVYKCEIDKEEEKLRQEDLNRTDDYDDGEPEVFYEHVW